MAKHKRMREYDQAFYTKIVGEFNSLVKKSHRPTADLAEAYGVDVTTARRWVREAGRRGFLVGTASTKRPRCDKLPEGWKCLGPKDHRGYCKAVPRD